MTEGGDLRAQLEAALKQNKALGETNRKYLLRDVADDFALVTPDDLQTVEGDEKALKAHAAKVQTERVDQQKNLLKSAGLDDDAVEKVLAGQKLVDDGQGTGKAGDTGIGALAGIQTTSGETPPKVDNANTHGPAAIKAHFREKSSSS